MAERIATFDQDGTLWVEHPVFAQLTYCLERVLALVKEKPELVTVRNAQLANRINLRFALGGSFDDTAACQTDHLGKE